MAGSAQGMVLVKRKPKTANETEIVRLIQATTTSTPIGNFAQLVQDMSDAGIVIGKERIAIKAKQTDIVDNNGNVIAMFSNGKLNASLIDADTITVNHLWAKSSQGGTSVGHFGNYDIDAAKISGVGYPLWLGATTAANAPFRVSKDGELYAAKGIFKGEIQGVTGSFYKLSAISRDGKNTSGGDMLFRSEGQIEFNADIYNQGTKTGRGGWRFYAANVWVRSAFGHRESTCVTVHRGEMYIYPDGYGNTATKEYKALESVSYDGKTVYKIPLYSPTNNSSGCPIDVVIFTPYDNDGDYYYEFVPGGTGKRWIAINANDNKNTIHFCDAGGWHTLGGGWSINMFYIDPGLLTPSQASKTYLGRGIFWTGEIDLNWKNR